jgi:hypothetical protein
MGSIDPEMYPMIRGLIVIGAAVSCVGLGGKSTSAGVGGDKLSIETSKDLEGMQAAARKSNYSCQRIAFLSNNIGPRLSGSPQAAAAAAYLCSGSTCPPSRLQTPSTRVHVDEVRKNVETI